MRLFIDTDTDTTETSRRVGWAKYYEAREEADDLRRVLKRVCEGIIYDRRFRNEDDLVVLVMEVLKSL